MQTSRIAHKNFRPAALMAFLAATLLLGAGCASIEKGLESLGATPYKRNLPDWIMRAYVPMAENLTTEPGLEELITNAFTEEMLLDGRIDPVRKSKSNVIVKILLKEYKEFSEDFASDDIESMRQIDLTYMLELYDPTDLENPIGVSKDVLIEYRYYSAHRSVRSALRVDAMDKLSAKIARRLMRTLLSHMEMVEG